MFTIVTPKLSAIPTTLITGFLGVGKTTAILNLLANKPQNENWAVLVNEFGEIGIDSALLAGNAKKNDTSENGVFIREVPGGCMCCASGVPMQVALNQLITKAKPDRLIIEPTGLGHPKEVVDVLTSGKYQELISLQSIFCLVDARNLTDTRYTQHPSFIQQLKVADTILAAKADQYSAQDEENLSRFIKKNNLTEKPLHLIQQGKISPDWLSKNRSKSITNSPMVGLTAHSAPENTHELERANNNELELNHSMQTQLSQKGYIELNNQGEGYFSKGWIFSNKYMFDQQQLIALISSLKVARIKGVVVTNKGHYSFNKSGNDFSYDKITSTQDSRIELIDTNKCVLNEISYEQLLKLNVIIS